MLFQVDKLMGGIGGGSKGRKASHPPAVSGPLSRPASVSDFNEVEEDSFNSISQMSDQEILQEFEKMLENMNLSEVRETLPQSLKKKSIGHDLDDLPVNRERTNLFERAPY